jgi:predicted RNA-binding Zn ribbon-like protein
MTQPEQLPACLGFLHTPFDPAEPEPSTAVRTAVLRVRDFLERLLQDEARGAGASDADLERLDRALARAGMSRGIVPTVRGYGWGWRRDPGEVTRRTFPALWSAGQLLTSDDRHRLKRCDGCGRLFLDRSRNRSRRWCVMEGCGNRDKVRRFRLRSGS